MLVGRILSDHLFHGASKDFRDTPILEGCNAFDLSIEGIRYLNLRSFHAINYTAPSD
jgi:hypothetical protein